MEIIPKKFIFQYISIILLSLAFIIGLRSLETDKSVQSFIVVIGLIVSILGLNANGIEKKYIIFTFMISISSYGTSIRLFEAFLVNNYNHVNIFVLSIIILITGYIVLYHVIDSNSIILRANIITFFLILGLLSVMDLYIDKFADIDTQVMVSFLPFAVSGVFLFIAFIVIPVVEDILLFLSEG